MLFMDSSCIKFVAVRRYCADDLGRNFMNGAQLERVLDLIDASVAANLPVTQSEVLQFIADHEDEVVEQLRRNGVARVPTSSGSVSITLSDLNLAAA